MTEQAEDTVEVELAELYIERERLLAAEYKTEARWQQRNAQLARLESGIARLEAMRS